MTISGSQTSLAQTQFFLVLDLLATTKVKHWVYLTVHWYLLTSLERDNVGQNALSKETTWHDVETSLKPPTFLFNVLPQLNGIPDISTVIIVFPFASAGVFKHLIDVQK